MTRQQAIDYLLNNGEGDFKQKVLFWAMIKTMIYILFRGKFT